MSLYGYSDEERSLDLSAALEEAGRRAEGQCDDTEGGGGVCCWLLVPAALAGCLLGLGGERLKALTESTSVKVRGYSGWLCLSVCVCV